MTEDGIRILKRRGCWWVTRNGRKQSGKEVELNVDRMWRGRGSLQCPQVKPTEGLGPEHEGSSQGNTEVPRNTAIAQW